MKKLILSAFILLLPIFGLCQKAQYQGLFLYQFSKYIEWPPDYLTNEFVIAVFGNEKTLKSVQEMAASKIQTQGLNIIVKHVNSAKELVHPQIVFIDESFSDAFNSVIKKINNQPVLLVTESPGLGQKGSIINFIEKEGKLRFELNQEKAEAVGLKVSGSLIKLAIVI